MQSISSPPDELDRGDNYGDATRLGTDGQNLGRREVAWGHVGWIRTEGHFTNQTLGDYGDCPRWLGSCESGRPGHGVLLNILCHMVGYRWRASGEYSVIAHDLLGSQSPFLSSSCGSAAWVDLFKLKVKERLRYITFLQQTPKSIDPTATSERKESNAALNHHVSAT